jgi:transketolase
VSPSLTDEERGDLVSLAHRVRRRIVHMAAGGGCFLGASLSCADLLVHLYRRILRVDASSLGDPDRDYLFLSKGHDVPALYGVLAELGFFDPARLDHHLKTSDHVYWHPNRALPGVEFHSGSLGHLLSVGIGVAIDLENERSPGRVFVVVGDGELDEGSIWEACLVAAGRRLDRLTVIVDRNGFQANARTEEILPLEPLAAKFEAFGWSAQTIDGHCFDSLEAAARALPFVAGRPSALIACTVRGKGLPSLESRADRWFVRLTSDEVTSFLAELDGEGTGAHLTETLVVR